MSAGVSISPMSKAFSFGSITKNVVECRACVLYAWVAATTTAAMGGAWQPAEVGMLGMTRATDACAELDTIGGLRARL
jgi:hypothetical protein